MPFTVYIYFIKKSFVMWSIVAIDEITKHQRKLVNRRRCLKMAKMFFEQMSKVIYNSLKRGQSGISFFVKNLGLRPRFLICMRYLVAPFKAIISGLSG